MELGLNLNDAMVWMLGWKAKGSDFNFWFDKTFYIEILMVNLLHTLYLEIYLNIIIKLNCAYIAVLSKSIREEWEMPLGVICSEGKNPYLHIIAVESGQHHRWLT